MLKSIHVLRLNREEQARTLPMALEMCFGFPNLCVLDLRWCPCVDDSLVANLCRAQCALSLQDMNLRGTLVSDEGVMCVVRCCPSLRTLDIGAWPYSRFRGIRTVSDVSLFFIAQCAALQGDSFALESLCIAGRRYVLPIPPGCSMMLLLVVQSLHLLSASCATKCLHLYVTVSPERWISP